MLSGQWRQHEKARKYSWQKFKTHNVLAFKFSYFPHISYRLLIFLILFLFALKFINFPQSSLGGAILSLANPATKLQGRKAAI